MREPLSQETAGWPGYRRVFQTVSAHIVPGPDSESSSAEALGELAGGAQKQADGKFSIHFDTVRGETPLARLSVNHADQEYQVTYPMSKLDQQEEVQNAVTGIQRRYAERAMLATGPGEDHDIRQAQKETAAPLADQVAELLCYQEALEIATTLDEATVYDENEVKRQSQFRDKLNYWYTEGLRMIRGELRNDSSGLAFVRGLLWSGKEVLIDIGIRLAREESIRPALQGDLDTVSRNTALPPQLRQRAFSYLRTEIRQARVVEQGNRESPVRRPER